MSTGGRLSSRLKVIIVYASGSRALTRSSFCTQERVEIVEVFRGPRLLYLAWRHLRVQPRAFVPIAKLVLIVAEYDRLWASHRLTLPPSRRFSFVLDSFTKVIQPLCKRSRF